MCNRSHKFQNISSLQKETPYPWAVTLHPHPQANPGQPFILSFLSGMYLELDVLELDILDVLDILELLSYMANIMFNFLRRCQTVFIYIF